MSLTVDDPTREALYAERTDKVFVQLITIDHADLAAPLLACDNHEPVKQNEGTEDEIEFVPFAFRLTWPEDHENRTALMRIQIDNVDREIVQTLRSLSSAPTVAVQLVRADDPDTVVVELPEFSLVEADYDAVAVEGQLSLESFEHEPWPHQRFTPASHPALFPL